MKFKGIFFLKWSVLMLIMITGVKIVKYSWRMSNASVLRWLTWFYADFGVWFCFKLDCSIWRSVKISPASLYWSRYFFSVFNWIETRFQIKLTHFFPQFKGEGNWFPTRKNGYYSQLFPVSLRQVAPNCKCTARSAVQVEF